MYLDQIMYVCKTEPVLEASVDKVNFFTVTAAMARAKADQTRGKILHTASMINFTLF